MLIGSGKKEGALGPVQRPSRWLALAGGAENKAFRVGGAPAQRAGVSPVCRPGGPMLTLGTEGRRLLQG